MGQVSKAWEICNHSQEPKDAQKYIQVVRDQYEAVLKILLRGYAADIEDDAFGSLAKKLSVLAGKNIAPFATLNIKNLSDCLNNASHQAIIAINLAHHDGKEKLSYPDAVNVNNFYSGKGGFQHSLKVFRDFQARITQDNNPVDNEDIAQVSDAANE